MYDVMILESAESIDSELSLKELMIEGLSMYSFLHQMP